MIRRRIKEGGEVGEGEEGEKEEWGRIKSRRGEEADEEK